MLVKINNQIVIDNKRRDTVFCVNTGRVKIGCAYIPPLESLDDDELLVQAALIGRQKRAFPLKPFLGTCLTLIFLFAIFSINS
jgi:hypothetical protein